ncbi:MAG: helix-turn-helix domain-containing protein [Clostridia bacterium]|jgi:AraC-like DNA-binding protein|nr:helix-turn-helix transcriptional regulator [Clostridiales bacterium]
MNMELFKMFGEGPYPLPFEHFTEKVDIYMDSGICITIPKESIDFVERAQHVHDSYEFIVPCSAATHIYVEKSHCPGEKGKIYPMNSGQAHGPYYRMLKNRLIAINVDRSFMDEIAYMVYGKTNVYFKPGNYVFGKDLRTLVRTFVEEYKNTLPGRNLVLKNLSTQIVVCLLRRIDNNMPSRVSSGYKTRKGNIDRAIEYIRDSYDGEYTLEEAAKIAHLSPYYFIKAFKACTGKPPYEYIMSLRIQKAKELLSLKNMSVTETCFLCGFNNPSNFTTYFKRKVGMTPSEYRKNVLK